MINSDAAVQCYIDALLAESENRGDSVRPAAVTALRSELVSVGEGPFKGRSSRLKNPFLRQLDVLQRRGGKALSADFRPVWGREDFRCLCFNVAGLRLALPLQFVEAVATLKDLLLPATAADAAAAVSVLGEISVGENGMLRKVVDTAKLVMPERYEASLRERYRSVLVLRGCDWCFAVDSIADEIVLSPQQVRWRSEHTRRAWLAGTVVDKKCALLDIDALDRQLMADWVLSDWE